MNGGPVVRAISDRDAGSDEPPRPVSRRVTLADLLAAKDLQLRQLTGPDPDAITIVGAHSIEIVHPTRWLPPDWVVLTTGLRLRGRAADQRALIAELKSAGMAALGYAVGITSQHVPSALLDQAQKLDFPVFTIPLKIRLHAVEDAANRMILQTDPSLMQRMVSVHAYLAGSSGEESTRLQEPVECAIARRLSALVGVDVVLLGPAGWRVWPQGPRVPDGTVDRLGGATGETAPTVQLEGRSFHGLGIHSARGLVGWLLYGERPGSADTVGLPAIRAAANLIAFVHDVREHEPTNVAATRIELLADLIGGNGDQHDLHERMAKLGFTFREPIRIILADGSQAAGATCDTFERELNYSGTPYLRMREDQQEVFCLQATESLLRANLHLPHDVLFAVGRPARGPAQVPSSYRSAQFIWAKARHHGQAGASYWEDLPPSAWLISSIDTGEHEQWAQHWLEPLAAQPLLLEGVVSYLKNHQDVVAAANDLCLHPNSLRYRLQRAEDLMDRRLREPALVADLYTALVAVGVLPPG